MPLIMPALRVLGPWPSPIGLSAAVRPIMMRGVSLRNAPDTTGRAQHGAAFRPVRRPSAGGPPRQLVVLLHGVGADGHDLIGLAPMLAERLPHALFVAPDAPEPCDMAPYGRQWFSLQDRRPAAMLAGARRTAPLLDDYLDELLAPPPPGREPAGPASASRRAP